MDELILNGKKFISSRKAALAFNYSPDYVGQLCRERKVEFTRVGKRWFISEESLEQHRKASEISLRQNGFSALERSSFPGNLGEPMQPRRMFIPAEEISPAAESLSGHQRTFREEWGKSVYVSDGPAPSADFRAEEFENHVPPLEETFSHEITKPIPVSFSLKKAYVAVLIALAGVGVLSENILPYVTEKKFAMRETHAILLQTLDHANDQAAAALFGGKENSLPQEIAVQVYEIISSAGPFSEEVAINIYRSLEQLRGITGELAIGTYENISDAGFILGDKTLEAYDVLSHLSAPVGKSVSNFFESVVSSLDRDLPIPRFSFHLPAPPDVMKLLEEKLGSPLRPLSPTSNSEVLLPSPEETQSQEEELIAQESSPPQTAIPGEETPAAAPARESTSPATVIIERAVASGLSAAYVDEKLNQLENKLSAQIFSVSAAQGATETRIIETRTVVAQSQRIDELEGVSVSNNSSWNGGTIANVAITGSSFSGTTGEFSGGITVGGSLSAGGSAFVIDAAAGNVGIGTSTPYAKLSVVGEIVGANFTATSTSATSTFYGGLVAARVPTIAHTFSSWTPGAASSGYSSASLVIDPASAAADTNLLALAVGGSVKFLVDAEGDVFANSLTTTGTVTLSTTTASTFVVENNTTLGDAITDTTTVNGTLIVTGTTTASTIQGKFGVGTTSPWARLSVAGLAGGTDPLFSISSSTSGFSTTTVFHIDSNGLIGVGTTTPWGLLSVNANAIAGPAFVVGSSTATSFIVTNGGNIGIGTTSPYAPLSVVGALGIVADKFAGTSTTATSTFAGGFAIETSGFVYDFSSNKVGIGTAAPTQTLDVQSSGDVAIRALTTSGSSNLILTGNGGTSRTWALITGSSDVGTATNFGIRDSSGGATRFVIDTSGNVGIGATSPFSKLTVQGTSGAGITDVTSGDTTLTHGDVIGQYGFRSIDADAHVGGDQLLGYVAGVINDNGGDNLFAGSDNEGLDLAFYTGLRPSSNAAFNVTEKLRIDKNGNIGIGTTTPWAQLAINPNGISGPALAIGSSTTSYFVVTNGGKVGIGTANPATISSTASLVVNGVTSGTVAVFGNSSNNAFLQVDAFGSLTDSDSSVTIADNLEAYNSAYLASQSGSVGIGTASPGAKLAILSSGANQGLFVYSNAGATMSSDTMFQVNGLTNDSTGYIARFASLSDGTRMVIRNDGNVGIGTTTPQGLLSVNGSSPRFVFTDTAASGNGFDFLNASNGLYLRAVDSAGTAGHNIALFQKSSATAHSYTALYSGNTETLRLTGGNVGIGTTTPTAKLTVTGDVSDTATPQLTLNGSTDPRLALRLGYNTTSDYAFIDSVQTGVSGKNLVLNASGGKIGVGTTTPWAQFAINPNGISGPALAIGSSTATNFVVTNGGLVGIGTAAPSQLLTISNSSGAAAIRIFSSGNDPYLSFGDNSDNWALGVDQSDSSKFKLSHTSGTPGTSDVLVVTSGLNVGIGTTSPYAKLSVNSSDSNATHFAVNNNSPSLNSTSVWFSDTDGQSHTIFRVTGDSDADSGGPYEFVIRETGKVGVGTTSPYRKFSVTDTSSQAAFAYDGTRYADVQVDSAGDLIFNPSGDDVFLNDDNLFVCTGGACPTGSPTGNGNLIVENKIGIGTSTPGLAVSEKLNVQGNTYITGSVYGASFNDVSNGTYHVDPAGSGGISAILSGSVGIGTTTPTKQLSISDLLYVGAGGATGLGTATSTFQGDIKIIGKLDVGTIDPVYTIDGVKYATYGHSTIGIKEEVVLKITPQEYLPERELFAYRINFSSLPKGSDLWLFYQVTNFGDAWQKLVVTLSPGFEGEAFYEEHQKSNELVIYAEKSAPVSVRLIADRYDAGKWPNLRPDQDDPYTGHILPSKDF